MILIFMVDITFTSLFLLTGLFPSWSVPASLQSGGSVYSVFGTLGTYAGQMSEWVDFRQVAFVLAAMGVVFVSAGVIWLFRRVGTAFPIVGRFFDN